MLEEVLLNYRELAQSELQARWEAWNYDVEFREVHEVVGGIVSRQVSLATQLALSPQSWNGHIAPLVLRAQADNHINLAWILDDPISRSREFIDYGIGQIKLDLELRKSRLDPNRKDAPEGKIVEQMEAWLNSQRWHFLTEVNVGSWSGENTRSIADKVGLGDFYRFVFQPFSACTHNTWQHIVQYNLSPCTNPLHRDHRVPDESGVAQDFYFLELSAKYLQKTFTLMDDKLKLGVDVTSAYKYLTDWLDSTAAESSERKGDI